jgi:hypothetical protein
MPDGAELVVSMFVSTIGLALLIYGKKQQRLPQIGVGIVMMIYPYFIPSALLDAGIAACLLILMTFGIRAGM